jgi:hypothetical protein
MGGLASCGQQLQLVVPSTWMACSSVEIVAQGYQSLGSSEKREEPAIQGLCAHAYGHAFCAHAFGVTLVTSIVLTTCLDQENQ